MPSPVPPSILVERPSQLRGYRDATTPAVVAVASYDAAARLKRSVRGLLQFWGAALLGLFIPIAHFFLVPGFLVAGVVVFLRRRNAALVVISARGVCPDCGAEQSFDVPSRWQPELKVDCTQCHRRLSLTALDH